MKKNCFFAAIIVSLLFFTCTTGGGGSLSKINVEYEPRIPDAENSYPLETMGQRGAFDYFKSERLSVGWNLGNGLDSHTNGVGSETAWGNPAINQALMNGVKAQGFNVIRIPVTWMGHIGGAPDYHINGARLNRVAQVVEMAKTAGLKVIINLHHDGAIHNVGKDVGWLSVGKAYKSNAEYAKITNKYVRVWKQIAIYFRNYGDWLMFESLNEVHDGGWCWSESFKTEAGVQAQFKIVNEWNQLFTDVVRSTGGNNASRYLVIPSYCTVPECTYPGGKIESHPIKDLGSYFKIPADSAEGKQVITFHYYRPDDVGLGNEEAPFWSWGNADQKEQIDDDFKPFKAAYIDKGIPVIIGECGATRRVFSNSEETTKRAHQTRLAYLDHVFRTAKKYGLVPIYWDNGAMGNNKSETFGLFNRVTGQPASNEFKECINAMINAVK
jgi:endoglucanase